MKITKERLKKIIFEEIEKQETSKKEDVGTRQQLAIKLKQLSKAIPGANSIDSTEAELINSILDIILAKANGENSRTILSQILDITKKKAEIK